MARVFIVEPPTVNVEKAGQFGEVKILLNDEIRISALDCARYAGRIIEELEKEEFNPKEDFFCLVGSMSSVSVSVAAMVVRWGGIKCLLYNGSRSEYVLRTLGRWQYTNKWKESNKWEGV